MNARASLVALSIAVAMLPACRPEGRTAPPIPSPIVTPLPTAVAMTKVPQVHPEPRVTLTASDGTGLRLVHLDARAVVDEPLALTEMRMSFENPLDRTLEGNFRFTLPQGASVSRFAMKAGGIWQEGEVVELQRARRAYEDFLHKKQDPALLEQAAGSEFSARVFPIPAHGVKELIVSYSEEIDAGAGYTLPLRGLPELGELDVLLTRAGASHPEVSLHQTHTVPADVTLPAEGADFEGWQSEDLVLTRVRPKIESAAEPLVSTVVLFDTSASRALGFAEQINVLTRIVGAIVEGSGSQAPLAVACFDQSVEAVFEGTAGGFGATEIARIEQHGALGASDIGRALAWAGSAAKKSGYKRVVVVTDGVATAGAVKGDELVATARGLRDAGVDRLDAVAVGGIRDDAGLRRLVTGGLAHDGVVADGALDEPSLARRLTLATRSGIAVKVDGATWSWPATLDGVQPGDERSVYAELPGKGRVVLDVDGQSVVPKLRPVDRALLDRTVAQAKITSLLDQKASGGEDVAKRIVDLSLAHRVVSPYTAMIVLETDADYARFHIDRRSAADILAINGGLISTTDRAALATSTATTKSIPTTTPSPIATATAANLPPGPLQDEVTAASDPSSATGNMWGVEVGDSFGSGGLGLTGVGGGGGGEGVGFGSGQGSLGTLGHGALRGAHSVSAPSIRQSAVTVSGHVPAQVIQRIVRQNFGRLRVCYERGLNQQPTLAGRVAVRFVIGRDGAVLSAEDGGSDLRNPEVVACVVRSFLSLAFPVPDGGTVSVVYPIVFSPEGEASSAAVDPASDPVAPPPPPPPPKPEPYTGRFKNVMAALARGDLRSAGSLAADWHAKDPGDVLGLVALGEVFEATKDTDRAARAYGSIIDLFAARADLRRFAGERLEHVHGGGALDVAIDTYAKAVEERPDHPSSHRLLAFALLKNGDYAKAFDAAVAGVRQRYPGGRFAGVDQVLKEDLGLIGAAWMKNEPKRRDEIVKRIGDVGGTLEHGASLRFVLTWETDANDVDFHIYDAKGNHAFYSAPQLASGGSLYADVTTGYGPECFTIRASKANRAGPYLLQANYYSRGPMGYGMGKLEIIDHDGAGNLTFEERPYVVMVDQAFVELGTVR